jgi:hypothetical protein
LSVSNNSRPLAGVKVHTLDKETSDMPITETERRETKSSAPAAPQPQAQHAVCNGYGACSKSGCNCQGFEGSGGTCGNQGCGHSYQDHW